MASLLSRLSLFLAEPVPVVFTGPALAMPAETRTAPRVGRLFIDRDTNQRTIRRSVSVRRGEWS